MSAIVCLYLFFFLLFLMRFSSCSSNQAVRFALLYVFFVRHFFFFLALVLYTRCRVLLILLPLLSVLHGSEQRCSRPKQVFHDLWLVKKRWEQDNKRRRRTSIWCAYKFKAPSRNIRSFSKCAFIAYIS